VFPVFKRMYLKVALEGYEKLRHVLGEAGTEERREAGGAAEATMEQTT
jgi:hypothetical protein